MGSETRMAPLPAENRSLSSGVLVVDDERPIVDLLTRYLGQHGFRAVGAYSPEQALELVLSDPAIGVVISDVRMPGQSGLALAEELLASRPDSQALEVVLISGAGLPEGGSHDATVARAFDVLRKPFRPSEVASAAGRALKSAEARRQGAARGPVSDSLRPPSPAALQQLIGAVTEGLRGPLIPMLAAAEQIAHGPTLSESDLRAAARRIREDGLRLLAMLDAAAPREAIDTGRTVPVMSRLAS
jgi:CheY-like chemotaxis protein